MAEQDFYAGIKDNAADAGNGPANTGEEAEQTDHDETKESGQSALIPRFLAAGKDFQPGDEIVLKILADRGEDGYEVEYATGEGKETTAEDKRSGKIRGRMASMMGGGDESY